jgi:hypothetical protein
LWSPAERQNAPWGCLAPTERWNAKPSEQPFDQNRDPRYNRLRCFDVQVPGTFRR